MSIILLLVGANRGGFLDLSGLYFFCWIYKNREIILNFPVSSLLDIFFNFFVTLSLVVISCWCIVKKIDLNFPIGKIFSFPVVFMSKSQMLWKQNWIKKGMEERTRERGD